MKRITFIVPTFNRADMINEALVSILSQMSADDEIIVVDDGSTDDTAKVVKAASLNINYIYQSNAGKSKALNNALEHALGRYIWICDDDDILNDGAVVQLVTAAERTGAELVFGRYTRFQTVAGRSVDMDTGYWPDLSQGSLVRHILEDAFVMQNAALVSASAYKQVGGFNEQLPRSIDYEMFIRLALTSRMHFVDSMIFWQRKHDGARGPASARHAEQASFQVWRDNDRKIFEDFFKTSQLELFNSMYHAKDSSLHKRAALLQRACVAARHEVWDRALNDVDNASSLSSLPLSATEEAICRRYLNGKNGFAAGITPGIISELNRIARKHETGCEIVSQIVRGSLWQLRRGERSERGAVVNLLFQLGATLIQQRKRLRLPKPEVLEIKQPDLSRGLQNRTLHAAGSQ